MLAADHAAAAAHAASCCPPPQAVRGVRLPPAAMKRYPMLLLLVGLFLLVGCGAAPTEQNLVGSGAPSPRAVVESFLEDLNHALGDTKLAQAEVRQLWAERLAGHFAPSERVDQRTAMADLIIQYLHAI